MSKFSENAPPTYDEVMQTSTQPIINFKYSSDAVNHIPSSTADPSQVQSDYLQSYGAFENTPVSVVVQPVAIPPETIAIGGCPSCRIGVLEDSYSCLGLFCAIVLFPIGITCCLASKMKRCSNCCTEF